MVSATVSPATAAMSMPRDPSTRSRTWSPRAQRRARASSAEGGTELLGLLIGVGLVGHGATTYLRSGQVLAQARGAERRMQFQMERIVRVVAHGCLVHGEDIGQPEAPERVVAA